MYFSSVWAGVDLKISPPIKPEIQKKQKTKGKHQISVKGPNYNSENIRAIFCRSGFPWRKDRFSRINRAMCQWSPLNVKSLSACSHQEVCIAGCSWSVRELKESWRRVKASKKQQRTRHLLSTTHFPRHTELLAARSQQLTRLITHSNHMMLTDVFL